MTSLNPQQASCEKDNSAIRVHTQMRTVRYIRTKLPTHGQTVNTSGRKTLLEPRNPESQTTYLTPCSLLKLNLNQP